jgi:hypothetical protein
MSACLMNHKAAITMALLLLAFYVLLEAYK